MKSTPKLRDIRIALALVAVMGLMPMTSVAAANPHKGSPPQADVVEFVPASEAATPIGGGISPMWGCLFNCFYLQNVQPAGINKPFVTAVQGNGPGTLHMSTTLTEANGYTATLGVDSGTVTAGVGFNVTLTQAVSYTKDVYVPSGKCYRIEAYNMYQDYTFDLWLNPLVGDPYKAGTGRAWNFIGVEYRTYFSCW